MTEAERRAAWEAAVTEALEAQARAFFTLAARGGIHDLMSDIWAAVADVHAMHEAVIDEPGVYVQDVPAERMTGDSVTVEFNAAPEGDTL